MTEQNEKKTELAKPIEDEEYRKAKLAKLEQLQEDVDDLIASLGNPNQTAIETIIGEKNRKVRLGNSLIHKSRIISGNYNRVAILLDFLEKIGLNVESTRNAVFGATLGFSPELAPNGMRGELIELVNPVRQPKKDVNQETPNPPTNQNVNNNPQGTQ
jgi:hypothetical protein